MIKNILLGLVFLSAFQVFTPAFGKFKVGGKEAYILDNKCFVVLYFDSDTCKPGCFCRKVEDLKTAVLSLGQNNLATLKFADGLSYTDNYSNIKNDVSIGLTNVDEPTRLSRFKAADTTREPLSDEKYKQALEVLERAQLLEHGRSDHTSFGNEYTSHTCDRMRNLVSTGTGAIGNDMSYLPPLKSKKKQDIAYRRLRTYADMRGSSVSELRCNGESLNQLLKVTKKLWLEHIKKERDYNVRAGFTNLVEKADAEYDRALKNFEQLESLVANRTKLTPLDQYQIHSTSPEELRQTIIGVGALQMKFTSFTSCVKEKGFMVKQISLLLQKVLDGYSVGKHVLGTSSCRMNVSLYFKGAGSWQKELRDFLKLNNSEKMLEKLSPLFEERGEKAKAVKPVAPQAHGDQK